MTTPTPYVPYAPLQGGLQAMFTSVVQVTRAQVGLSAQGDASVSWEPLTEILDPGLNQAGLMRCRLDLQFIRRGIDQPAPVIAGKAPDRVGVIYYLSAVDPATGIPLVLAGDRVVCVPHPVTSRLPVFGTFELRQVPDVAQDYVGGHHVETQIVEVSQSLKPGSVTPFPGATS